VELCRALLEERRRRVHLDTIPQAPDQRTHRAPGRAAEQVPQRDLHGRTGLRTHPLFAQPPPGEQPQSLRERVDGDEFLADQQRCEHVVDHGGDDGGIGAAVAVARFAPSHRAVVGGDLDEEERHPFAVRPERARHGLDVDDLHDGVSIWLRYFSPRMNG
jgi:hypothetical protein